MCLQLHSWNSSFLPSIFPIFSTENLYTFHLLLLDPPQRCLEQKILTPPHHQTLVVGRASSVWKVRPVAWNVTPMRPWMTFRLPGPLPSTVVSLTFPMGFFGIESPTSLGIFFVHSLEICPKQNFTVLGDPFLFMCAKLRRPCLCQQQKEASLQVPTGHRWFDNKICWKIWRKNPSNWRSFWTWKPGFSPNIFFLFFDGKKCCPNRQHS